MAIPSSQFTIPSLPPNDTIMMTPTNYHSSSSDASTSNSRQCLPGPTDVAETATQKSHSSHESHRTPEPSRSAGSTSELLKQINAYSKQGRWKDMARLQLKVLNIYRSNFGEAHPSTVSAMYNLAASYVKLKRLTDAEGLYRHVQLLRTHMLGEEHADTLRTMQNLATVCASLGKHFEAAEHFEKVLRIRQRTLGEGHPDTLSTMHNLAMAHTDLGNLETAEQLYQTVLQFREQALGQDHPNTLGTMRGLVFVYEALGRLEDARGLCESLLSLSDAKHGIHNAHSLKSLSALATIHRRLSDWRGAEELEIELLSRRRHFWGQTHPSTLISMKTVALIYHEQRRWNEAQALEAEIDQVTQSLCAQTPIGSGDDLQNRSSTSLIHEINATALARILGEDHPEVIDALEAKALSQTQAGEWKQAIKTLQEVLKLRQRVQGDDHLHTIQTMRNLGLAYLTHRCFAEATELFREALALLEQSQLPVNSDLQSSIEHRMSQAESYRRKSQVGESTDIPAEDQLLGSLTDDVRFSSHPSHTIASEATITDILACLTTRDCPDLTLQLDCTTIPRELKGKGGYSDLWQGTLLDGSPVALKCLRGDEKLLKHAARELYSWGKARHENVLELWGMSIFDDKIAMVSPWMESGNIIEYLEKHPEVDRLSMCVQVARGLAYLHSLPLVHGDIKASNVFVTADGTVKIGDFGLALLLSERRVGFSDMGDHAQGTVRWMAPELFEGDAEEADCNRSLESDVYALGMTILEIMTGKVPFWEMSSVVKVMRAVADHKRKPSPAAGISSLGEQGDLLWNLLNQCWDANPKNRPTAYQVCQQMEEILDYYQSIV